MGFRFSSDPLCLWVPQACPLISGSFGVLLYRMELIVTLVVPARVRSKHASVYENALEPLTCLPNCYLISLQQFQNSGFVRNEAVWMIREVVKHIFRLFFFFLKGWAFCTLRALGGKPKKLVWAAKDCFTGLGLKGNLPQIPVSGRRKHGHAALKCIVSGPSWLPPSVSLGGRGQLARSQAAWSKDVGPALNGAVTHTQSQTAAGPGLSTLSQGVPRAINETEA